MKSHHSTEMTEDVFAVWPIDSTTLYVIVDTHGVSTSELALRLLSTEAALAASAYGEKYQDVGASLSREEYERALVSISYVTVVCVFRQHKDQFLQNADKIFRHFAEGGFPIVGLADQYAVVSFWSKSSLLDFIDRAVEFSLSAFVFSIDAGAFAVLRDGNVEYYFSNCVRRPF